MIQCRNLIVHLPWGDQVGVRGMSCDGHRLAVEKKVGTPRNNSVCTVADSLGRNEWDTEPEGGAALENTVPVDARRGRTIRNDKPGSTCRGLTWQLLEEGGFRVRPARGCLPKAAVVEVGSTQWLQAREEANLKLDSMCKRQAEVRSNPCQNRQRHFEDIRFCERAFRWRSSYFVRSLETPGSWGLLCTAPVDLD